MNKKIVLFLVLGMMLVLAVSAFGAVPRTINVQGRLLDADNIPISGSKTLLITLMDQTGLSVVVSEQTFPVTLVNGIFSVNFNAGTDANFAWPYKFLVKVNGVPMPLQTLTSVPYALNAETVGGYSITNIVTKDAQGNLVGVVIPSSGMTVASADARYVNVSGDTMSGALSITSSSTEATLKAINDKKTVTSGLNSSHGIYAEASHGAAVYGKNTYSFYSGYFEGGRGVKIDKDLSVDGNIYLKGNLLSNFTDPLLLTKGLQVSNGFITAEASYNYSLPSLNLPVVQGKYDDNATFGELATKTYVNGAYVKTGVSGVSSGIGVYGNTQSLSGYSGYFIGGKGVKIVGSLEVTGNVSFPDSATGNFVKKSGDTMSGALTIDSNTAFPLAQGLFVKGDKAIVASSPTGIGIMTTGRLGIYAKTIVPGDSNYIAGSFEALDGIGVHSTSKNGTGVWGQSANGVGVYGSGATGGSFESSTGYAGIFAGGRGVKISGALLISSEAQDYDENALQVKSKWGTAILGGDPLGTYGALAGSDTSHSASYAVGGKADSGVYSGFFTGGKGVKIIGSSSGTAVKGERGTAVGELGTNRYHAGSYKDMGVYGKSDMIGVYGETNTTVASSIGVAGYASNGKGVSGGGVIGVHGKGSTAGGSFESASGVGVYGSSVAAGNIDSPFKVKIISQLSSNDSSTVWLNPAGGAGSQSGVKTSYSIDLTSRGISGSNVCSVSIVFNHSISNKYMFLSSSDTASQLDTSGSSYTTITASGLEINVNNFILFSVYEPLRTLETTKMLFKKMVIVYN